MEVVPATPDIVGKPVTINASDGSLETDPQDSVSIQ
jgi:hypothetical protein